VTLVPGVLIYVDSTRSCSFGKNGNRGGVRERKNEKTASVSRRWSFTVSSGSERLLLSETAEPAQLSLNGVSGVAAGGCWALEPHPAILLVFPRRTSSPDRNFE